MAEIVIVDIELNGLSVLGLHVLKAALTYAAAHRDVKEHDLSLDVNSDLKLIQFWPSQRFKTDTPPSPAHAGYSLFSSLVQPA
ncbi:hypothetical protein, partial [Massilia sp. DWR3-1-1]|uniref:hypothetical protein n=1 Tax=Massilia sp. DWR3-1-1 TaxID=2804559 RepID=UPI003CF47D67